MINSNEKGKQAERDVANYLTMCGLAARRHVRTGDSYEPDEGDIRIPGVTFEVKNWAGTKLTDGAAVTLLRKLESQKGAGNLGVLVDRRDRVGAHAAGSWWVWMTLATFCELAAVQLGQGPDGDGWGRVQDPIRMYLSTFVSLWKASGRAVVTNPFELTS